MISYLKNPLTIHPMHPLIKILTGAEANAEIQKQPSSTTHNTLGFPAFHDLH